MERDILSLLQKGAATPDEVAKRLSISWATANGHVLKLGGEGKAALVRKGRVNIYNARSSSTRASTFPSGSNRDRLRSSPMS